MKRRLDSGEPATDQDASPWSPELNSLGWRGAARDSPEARELRAHLAAHNRGISNCAELFAVRPGEVNVDRAAEIFHKYGFVVVQDALTQGRLQKLRHGVKTVVPEDDDGRRLEGADAAGSGEEGEGSDVLEQARSAALGRAAQELLGQPELPLPHLEVARRPQGPRRPAARLAAAQGPVGRVVPAHT